MKNILILLALCAVFAGGTAGAASLAQTDRDCAEILERWATDPDSVSKQLVDECKGIKGVAAAAVPDIAPAAGTPVAAAAAADPCAGDGAAGSVHCWGPWSAVAPAAGPAINPPAAMLAEDYDQRPELAEAYDVAVAPPEPPVPPPLGTCEPGSSCGFATIVAGPTSGTPGSETDVGRMKMEPDASQFSISPSGEAPEIVSVGDMSATFINRPDEYENMQANGLDGTARSRMIARVIRGAEGEIDVAADVWTHRDADGVVQSGYFAWGDAMTTAGLDSLNSGNVSAEFSGPMSVDNATQARIRIDFGTSPVWSGQWVNPAYTFDAGGAVTGVDLVSDDARFSENVNAGSYVQGVLVGQPESKSIAHVIDVDLAGVGRIRDVGLLRE